MTRTERKKLIKTRKVYRVLSGISLLFFILHSVIIGFSVRFDNPTAFVLFIIIALWMTPLIIGVTLTALSQSLSVDIAREINTILYNRQRIRVSLFWNLVKAKEYVKAKELYNMENYIINHSFRSLCNGILIGILLNEPIDDNTVSSDERMQEMIYGK